MIFRLLKRLGRSALRMTKRFLANQPANPYETIIFNAVRTTATQFGKGRVQPA